MRQCLSGVLTAFLLAFSLGSQAVAGNVEEELTQLFEEYIAAWNDGDYRRLATEIYRTPVYIFDQDNTAAFVTPDDIMELLAGLRIDLDAAGFSHSTLRHVGVCDLGDKLAFATLQFSRFDAGGVHMGEAVLSSAYIARETEAGWRLVAHVFQSKSSALNCK